MDKSHSGVPATLAPARNMAHAAAQPLYRAAAKNVTLMPGDEHFNLGWNAAVRTFETV